MASGALDGGTALAEQDFLAARRQRAARLIDTLELPQFKGKPGWEFTDISTLDLRAYAPARANGGAAAPAAPRGGAL